LLHIGKDHGGQFIMSPGEQFRMSLDNVMMPDLDGWSVLAALRQDPALAEIPVIMITIVDEQRRGIALGADGYLTKPIDRERLRHVIGRFRAPTRPTRAGPRRQRP
jgi:CheY-like chemotaxis protein